MELPSDAEVFTQYKNIERRLFRHQFFMLLKWVKSGQLYYHLKLMLTFFTVQTKPDISLYCQVKTINFNANDHITNYLLAILVLQYLHIQTRG